DLRVFVESDQKLHPAIRPFCQLLPPEPSGEGWQFLSTADLLIADYSQYYSLLPLLPLLAGGKPRILFDYHGVTPAGLWGVPHRELLEKSGQQRGLVWCADAAIVHSQFASQELTQPTGFPTDRLRSLSYVIDTEWLQAVEPGKGSLRRSL